MYRLSFLFFICACSVRAQEPNPAALEHFEKHVRPLLVEHCVACHGPKKQESGLRLDSRTSVFAEHEFGIAVIAGKPEQSRLLNVVRYSEDDVQMPPKGKLTNKQIQLLKGWIKSGAAWPQETDVASAAPDAWKNHWAFQPIGRPEPPATAHDKWSKTNIDRFIIAKLGAVKLEPQAIADVRTRVRRAFVDLIGLPPTLTDITKVESGTKTYEQTVDELLSSPHFGERWARHWMDVARYADTTGYVFREERKQGDAWKYREWLINAFNADMPIDEFLIQQIAVDKLPGSDAGDKLAATGFITLGRRFLNNKHDIIDDRIDVVTRGMMGFTVTCARCHDHKYDPIPTADYYSLYGVFASTKEPDRKKTALRLVDLPKPFNPYVFKRGKAGNHGQRVPRRFLSALADDPKPFANGSGRLEFARAIASADNPLTARVFVNRVWGNVFGSFLVDTPSDFGVRSNPPTHPQLLDYLAGSLIDNGWSMKKLLREMVLSSVYQQRADAEPNSIDPENRLLSRMNRKRLDFEAHRDAVLAASGNLDRTVGGESVDITKAPFPKRRTVYAYIDRQNLPGVFRAFDLASPDTHAPRRHQTTVPQQGLYQLNNAFVLEQSVNLASRTATFDKPNERVAELFRTALLREPSDYEISESVNFIAASDPATDTMTATGWQYGYGRYDDKTKKVVSFTPYPVNINESLQGGAKMPDPKLGWSFLKSTGGHPGDKNHAAIRRWVAPADGLINVGGILRHPAKKGQGDGVIARIVSSRRGQVNEWKIAHRAQPILIRKIEVKAGDFIDFVCDSGDNVSFDSFDWSIRIRTTTGDRFDSVRDFAGGPQELVDVWSRFAQVLLLSNEFVFLD